VTRDAFREELDRFREEVDREAVEMKDSYLALERLASLYERFDHSERELADRVLSEWVLSEDEAVRFDAMALIRKFGIVTSVSALRQLHARLETATGPGAPYERQKVDGLIAELTSGMDMPGT